MTWPDTISEGRITLLVLPDSRETDSRNGG